MLADLDSWLEANGLALAQMDAARVEDYLAFRRGQGHRLYRSTRGLAPLLTFLRGRSALPPEAVYTGGGRAGSARDDFAPERRR